MRKQKVFPKESDQKIKETIRELKQENRRLQKQVRMLKKEVMCLTRTESVEEVETKKQEPTKSPSFEEWRKDFLRRVKASIKEREKT